MLPLRWAVGGRMARAGGAPIPQSLCLDRDLASSRRMLLKLFVVEREERRMTHTKSTQL